MNVLRYLIVLVVLIGVVARLVVSSASDMWFDEVLTVSLVSPLSSWWEVFRINHDNNHLLNSLYLYLLGENSPVWQLRLPSTIFGLALIGAAVCSWPQQRSQTYNGTLTLILASSFLMLVYSTEARGYAGCLFFSLSLYLLPRPGTTEPQLARVVVVSALIVGGFLSHPLFYLTYFAFIFAECAEILKQQRSLEAAIELGKRHIVPCSVAIMYYVLFVHSLPPVSAPVLPYLVTVVSAFSQASGGPEVREIGNVSGIVGCWAALSLLAIATVSVVKGGFSFFQKVFIVVVVAIAPTLAAMLEQPSTLTERYLILSVLFTYVAAAGGFVAMCSRGRGWRWCGQSLLIVFLLLNAAACIRFVKDGRGHLSSLIRFIAEEPSLHGPIAIGGDHDARIGPLISFYAPRFARLGLGEIEYARGLMDDTTGKVTPRWLLSHHVSLDYVPPPSWQSPSGRSFALVRQTSRFGPSGFSFFLYRVDE